MASDPAAPIELPADDEVRAAVAEWRAWLVNERRASSHTVLAYARDLKAFFDFLARHLGGPASLDDLASLRAADFRAYLARARSAGLADSSIARALAAVKSFFRHLERTEVAHNPVLAAVRAPRLPRLLPKPLTEEQALAAVSEVARLSDKEWIGRRDVALLALLYGCGLRIGEALALQRRDAPRADAAGESAMVITGKGAKQRLVPVLPAVVSAIEAYLAACPYRLGPSGPLFVGARGKRLAAGVVQGTVRRLRGLLGLAETATPHALRHSFATRCATASPPTCWRAEAIFAPSRSFWATPPSPPPSVTPGSTPSGS